MSRIITLLLLSVVCFNTSRAQDFTVDELIALRSSTLPAFESAVMAKGYDLSDVLKDYDKYIVFKKDNHTIIFGYVRNAHSQATDTVVIYRTRDLAEYKALQAQKKEDPAHPNTTHFISDDSYILHMYIDGQVCLHFRAKRNDGMSYEVKVFPDNTDKYFHYANLNGDIDY